MGFLQLEPSYPPTIFDRLNKERHKLLGTMTNYSKSIIQIIMQKQTSFDLFKKNLK